MCRIIHIFTAVILIANFIFCQSIDSLQRKLSNESNDSVRGVIYVQLAGLFTNRDADKATTYLDSAISIKAYADLPEKKDKIFFTKGAIAERKQHFDSADFYFQKILNSQNPIKDTSLVAKTLYKLGNMARRQKNTDQAIGYLNRSKDLSYLINDPGQAASSDVVLGIIYKNNGQLEEAIKYYSSAYTVYEKESNYDAMATCILNIANVYGRQSKHEEALSTYNEALEVAQNVERNEGLLAFVYGNRGNTYKQLRRVEEALEDNKRAYELRKNRAGPEEKATSLIGLAHSLMDLDRYDEALSYFEEAKEISKESDGMLEVKERVYQGLFIAYSKRNMNAQAVSAVKQFLFYKDSLRNTELDKKVLELNEQLETERKENEIELLNTENELANSKLTAARRQAFGLFGGLILFSVLLFGLLRLYRKTQSQNAVITQALSEKETLLREIHHRVKNNLQFISSLLGLQTEHVQDEVALGALQGGQDRVQSMALIHQNLYQEDNLTGVDMQDYFIKLIQGLFDSYNIYEDQVALDLDIEDLNLDVDTVIPIGLVVNELISNSLKYAFPDKRKGTISISLKEKGDRLNLRVSDDGVGFTKEQADQLGTSFGYRLVHAFKEQLQAQISIDGSDGTTVDLLIGKYERV